MAAQPMRDRPKPYEHRLSTWGAMTTSTTDQVATVPSRDQDLYAQSAALCAESRARCATSRMHRAEIEALCAQSWVLCAESRKISALSEGTALIGGLGD